MTMAFDPKRHHDKDGNDDPNVVHPRHYNLGSIEVKDIIRSQKLNFSLGCAVKYICRSEYKGSKLQDLRKAIFYIQDEIDNGKSK